MAESISPKGLLYHELRFVTLALDIAKGTHKEALRLVGENVQDSGGDWAFDDSATRMAAEEAVIKSADVRLLQAMMDDAKKEGLIPYPNPTDKKIVPGSRVVFDGGGWEDTYDLGTHRIRSMPEDEAAGAIVVSVQSGLGEAMLGKAEGDDISWRSDANREFHGRVLKIDQSSQRAFYERLFGPAPTE